jgi:branched-chain amino acid transport system substrate-binding protein
MSPKLPSRKSLPPIAYIGMLFILFVLFHFGRKILMDAGDLSQPISLVPLFSSTSLDRTTLSSGEQSFFPEDGTPVKAEAIAAYALGDFSRAQTLFQSSLKIKPNDPESLIYLNNAKLALNDGKSVHTLAVSIPGEADANSSREILRGVAQAQAEINDANTTRFRVVITRDNNDPNLGKRVAEALVAQPNILGVVGHCASDVSLATSDIYERGQLVMISPVSTSVELSNKSAYFLRTVPSDFMAARALGEHMLNRLKLRKAVIYFNSRSRYSRSIKGELMATLALHGGEVVQEYDLANSGLSPMQSLLEADQLGAEVIILAGNAGSLEQMLQVVQANRRRLPILAGDDVYSPKTLDIGGAAAENMVIAVPWHILANDSASFAQRSDKFWKSEVNWRTAMAYDATQALGKALQQASTRQNIQQILRTPGFTASGASSNISFMPSGDRNASVQLVKVVLGNSPTRPYRFVPIP